MRATYQSFQHNLIYWDRNHMFLAFLIRLGIHQYLDMGHVTLAMSHSIRLRRSQSNIRQFHIRFCLHLWVRWSRRKSLGPLDWYFRNGLSDNGPLKWFNWYQGHVTLIWHPDGRATLLPCNVTLTVCDTIKVKTDTLRNNSWNSFGNLSRYPNDYK